MDECTKGSSVKDTQETSRILLVRFILPYQMVTEADEIVVELLLNDSQVRALGQPPPRHHLELFNYMWGYKPIAEGKDDFIFYAEDFVSATKHSEKGSRIGDFIESCLDHFPDSPLKVGTIKHKKPKSNMKTHH